MEANSINFTLNITGGKGMYCSKCGAKIEDNSKVCARCGEPLRSIAVKKKRSIPKTVIIVILFIIIIFSAIGRNATVSNNAKTNSNEVVDTAHNVTVGDLQQLAAECLSSIETQYGMNNAQSIGDISYDITSDGESIIVITCSKTNGNVAFYAINPKSKLASQIPGGCLSYSPSVYFGLYTGTTMQEEPIYSISGSLAIEPVVNYARSKWGF
jgi:hypothetical protein